jgi:hypothetical protein
MDKPALDAVFLGAPDGAPPESEGAPTDGAPSDPDQTQEETEQALDDSIDEIFSTEDPTARREAFKRAMLLCNQSQY